MADSAQPTFTLGSASPRRANLLASLGLSFDIETVDIDEAALIDDAQPDANMIVERIATAKFAAFPARSNATQADKVLLTADTLVACDGAILGKPDSVAHLRAMVTQMSGRPLTISTAVAVGERGGPPTTAISSTVVVLRELAADEIDHYVASAAGMDKAGGLALQDQAKPFIESVSGCWANVLGLPLCVAKDLLTAQFVRSSNSTPQGQDVSCSVELCGRHDR